MKLNFQNRPVVHKPKALNANGKVIEIFENMSVRELAIAMDKDIGYNNAHHHIHHRNQYHHYHNQYHHYFLNTYC